MTGNFGVVGFGADRVGFPQKFLRQEVEFSTVALSLADDLLELVKVAVQADDLFRNIDSFRKYADLTYQVGWPDRNIMRFKQLIDAFGDTFCVAQRTGG